MKNIKLKNIIFMLICISLSLLGWQTPATDADLQYWKVLMAEAVSEGYEGMYAVACVIRNRGGRLNGFCGANREDLDGFCIKQGKQYISIAKTVERHVFIEDGWDVTFGASHFENIEKFGEPCWTKGMISTAKIGNHTFYKEAKNS